LAGFEDVSSQILVGMMIASLTCAEFGKHDSDEDEGFLGQMETEYLIRRFFFK